MSSPHRIRPPEHLGRHHDVSDFCNGKHPMLDNWLQEQAWSSEGLSARTYVMSTDDAPTKVIGYYAISMAKEQRKALPSAKLRRGAPEDVPLLLIGRLALDQNWQGQGLGSALLVDALQRCLMASEIAGIRAVLVHALDDEAVGFYLAHGFMVSPLGERTLIMPIEIVRATQLRPLSPNP